MTTLAPRLGLLLAWAAVTGCHAPSPSAPRVPPRPRLDKAALYGDPALVPTREGEQARAELARAGELEAMIGKLGGVASVRADVSLGPARTLDRALVLVLHRRDEHEASDLRREIETVITATLPPGPATLMLERAPADPEPADPRPPLAIALVFLGFGLSLGVAFERARQRR